MDFKVSEYMSSPVISINAEDNIHDAVDLVNLKKIGSLFVKEGESYVGIITKTDLIQKVILKKLDYRKTIVYSIMTDIILTIDSGASIKEAVGLMGEKQIRH